MHCARIPGEKVRLPRRMRRGERLACLALTVTAGCFSSSSSPPHVEPEPDGSSASEDAATDALAADASKGSAPDATTSDATTVEVTSDAAVSDSTTVDAVVSFDATLDASLAEGGDAASAPHQVVVIEGNGKGYQVSTLLSQGGSLYFTIGDVLGSSVLLGAFTAGLDGGAITTLASSYTSSAFNQICGATTDGTYLYWVACGNPVTIAQIPLSGTDGGPPTVLATDLSNVSQSIAVASNQVFFASGPTTLDTTQEIESVPASGSGSPTGLTPGSRVSHFGIDGTNAYWTSPAPGSPYDAGTLLRAPLAGVPDGGSPTTMAGGLIFPDAVEVFGGNVYWINDGDYQNDDAVMTMPVTGAVDAGAPTTLLFGAGAYGPLAVDADGVFFALDSTNTYNNPPGSIVRIPLDGSPAVTIATGIGSIVAIATDATNVYWVDSTLQQIAKTTKY